MKEVTRRVRRLEARFGCGDGSSEGIRLVVCRPSRKPALDEDACIEILRECGFLPVVNGIGVHFLDFGKIPGGLNAKETERFLRENGSEICGFRSAQNHGGPAGGAHQENQRR
jgi:hypothetical protein